MGTIKNPYWDWDGILVTEEEEQQLNENGVDEQGNPKGLQGEQRRSFIQAIKLKQEERKVPQQMIPAEAVPEGTPAGNPDTETPTEGATEAQAPTPEKLKPYYFNYFDFPRKPYIFGTIFNNENTPIGRTDMITLSAVDAAPKGHRQAKNGH